MIDSHGFLPQEIIFNCNTGSKMAVLLSDLIEIVQTFGIAVECLPISRL